MALPVVAQAQGVPGGSSGARARANGPPVRSAPWSAASLGAWSVASLAFSASTNGRAFTAMSWNDTFRPITIVEDVRVGAVLPDEGVTYYEVPPEYGVRDYRYTVVNGRTVLVDPRTHRIVEVVE